MSRLFGIAGVQMSVVNWDADATFEKMSDVTMNIHKQFPWVNMITFHELIVPALVQFVTPDDKDWWKREAAAQYRDRKRIACANSPARQIAGSSPVRCGKP